MRKLIAAAVGMLALILGGAAPATATGGEHPPAPKLEWSVESACGLATIAFTNNTKFTFWGDYKVDDAEPVSTDLFGPLWTQVEVPGGQTIAVEVELDEDTGIHKVYARWARGPESDWYDWDEWKHVKVYTDCSPAKPTVEQPTCEDPIGHITIPKQDNHRYTIEGQPAGAGDHERVAGDYLVEVYRKFPPHKPAIASWVLTVNPAPSEDECNPPGGDENGTEEGTETGTEEGTEEGTETGTETGGDDGDEGGTPTPTPEPTEPPTGTDEGADDGTDEELPDTGMNESLLSIGIGLLIAGGLALAVIHHRRRQTI